tara:strand:- start:36 stop:713 length:678 start_codon:yes stop_codon:yes gene_type:complete
MKLVSLLCRGESLKNINKLSKANNCILVNAFHHELTNNNVHEYVSKCKTVTHVLSPGAYFPAAGAAKIYKNYNFDKIVLPYIKQCSPSIPDSIQNLEGPNGILPVEYLSDINKEDMVKTPRYEFTAPTTGLDALLYCVNQLKPDQINIIGLDFYDQSGYFSKSHGREFSKEVIDRKHAIRSGEPTDRMQKFFIKIIEKNLNTQFNLYTKSNIEYKNKNLKVSYYE